jgi:hypothetical protein
MGPSTARRDAAELRDPTPGSLPDSQQSRVGGKWIRTVGLSPRAGADLPSEGVQLLRGKGLVDVGEVLAAHHARIDDALMSLPPAPSFTPKQGQYLAFIYAYTRVLGRPPAEADLQRHFGVSPPSVHQMVLTLERAGLIRRQPGVARSIEILFAPELLPVLR